MASKRKTNSWIVAIAVLVGSAFAAIKFKDQLRPYIAKIGMEDMIYGA